MWDHWRSRQRIEEYQETLSCTRHFGYLDTCRRALVCVLGAAKLPFAAADVEGSMQGWGELIPFPDVLPGLEVLRKKSNLVVLSNGENEFRKRLVKRCIRFAFDAVISVQDVGVFKPSPHVYRYLARTLAAEPHELMMVSAHASTSSVRERPGIVARTSTGTICRSKKRRMDSTWRPRTSSTWPTNSGVRETALPARLGL